MSEPTQAVAREVEALAVVADVSREEDIQRLVRTVESELGPIDIFVSNAGITVGGRGGFRSGLAAAVGRQRHVSRLRVPGGAAGNAGAGERGIW